MKENTIILGKRSYLSTELKKKIEKSQVYSLNEFPYSKIKNKKYNIIINSFYSSYKLKKIDSYEEFFNKSILEISNFIDKFPKDKIKKIIYSSSSSIYNSINDLEFKDSRNRKIYSSTKYTAESLVKNFCDKNKIKLCITRIFNLFGEKEQFSIISKIINAYSDREKTLILTNKGQSVRDFIHVKDVASVYKKILSDNYEGIIDIGTGHGTKIIDIVNKLNIKKFKIKNIQTNESQFSISQNPIKNHKYSLENYLKNKLKLKKKPIFEKIFFKKKNLIQDYLHGSIIYGAGKTGQELFKTYRDNQISKISYFVDDDEKVLQKKEINGVKILSFNELEKISKIKIINNIIVAIPSLSNLKLKNLINKLSSITLNISILNSNFIGEKNYLSLSDVSSKMMSEILNRPTKNRLNHIKNLKNKKVLITGAGGSIGSELVKQSLICGSKVIALDHSELALYNLEKELNINFIKSNIKTVLGSINDKRVLKKIENDENIDIIFHAAAYKHVNLLEKNVSLAVENNIFGTQNILENFNKKKHHLIIISTDKAARPKSILGATKRISEIICQKFIKLKKVKSNIKIVRFGNVFGSKGSAIELFIDQLNKNIPITLTHQKVKRYFMSMQEACNLVLDITRLYENDKIFILDMGEQILIKNIIYKLASIKNIPKSQVKIKITGLKKGEKLLEELSINKKLLKTKNKEIFLAKERNYETQLINDFVLKLKKSVYIKNDILLKKMIFSFLNKEK